MPSGGKREGAGRKPSAVKGLETVIAQNLFDVLGGESKAWESLMQAARAHDPRLVFDILRFWTDRKYGKARNINENNITGKIQHEHIDLSNFSDEQLAQLAALVESAYVVADTE